MQRTFTRLALVLILTPALLAQLPPKPGRMYHQDTVEHGFRFKHPKDWAFFPAEFGQLNVLGKYVPERNDQYDLGDGDGMKPICWMLVFDKDYKPKDGDSGSSHSRYHKSFKTWLKANPNEVGKEYELIDEDDAKFKGGLTATMRLYKGKGRWAKELHLWTMTYHLTDRKDVVVMFNAPATKKKWGKWKSGLAKIGKTFGVIEVKGFDASAVEGTGVRATKHRKLLAEVAANPGWDLYATDNYFVISNSDDKDFVEEIQRRLEAIRERFESEFPAKKALRAFEVSKTLKARKGKDGENGEAGGDGEDGQDGRTVVATVSPLELSRCSVVRVCNSRDDYFKYGGPQGSAGYWWSVSEELVIFDDKAVGGRRSTWSTLNHEAFHQFIFYFFGSLSPGYWFNEGSADYYAGHKLSRRGAYDVGRFDWRNQTIKEEIREKKNVPLEMLVDLGRAVYYGNEAIFNPKNEKTRETEQFSRYAHGWSFVYFLRTGKRNRAKDWKDEYGEILETYLDALIETRDIDKANEAAFAGIDWKELEKCWETYILKGK
jgi:hypothetical protein